VEGGYAEAVCDPILLDDPGSSRLKGGKIAGCWMDRVYYFLQASLGWGGEVPLDGTVEKFNLLYDTQYTNGVNEMTFPPPQRITTKPGSK